jgi:hypothetical protein
MAGRTTKVTLYLSVYSSQTFADCGQGSRCGGPGEVPRPFIHPVWMPDAVWGQTVRSASQTGVHRARWANQTSLGNTYRTCNDASGLQYVANVAGVA